MMLATAPSMATLPVYNWQEPAHIQEADWDCSQESLEWMLFAYQRTPDDTWMEQSLQAGGYVNPAVGCTDATGAGLARWLNEQYGEYGYLSSNTTGPSYDQVAAEAADGKHPLAMGGGNWYHWSGVRGVDGMGRLMLANPAPGWQGVYQTLDRDQWARLGPWNMVRLTHPQAEGASGPDPAPITSVYGPDVSSHQGYVDWASVRASGCTFGATKATGGAWYSNPTFQSNWLGLAANNMVRMAYHFAFESSGQPLPGPGPIVEADYFLSRVMPLGLTRGDILVLDIEQGNGQLGGWALDFCRHVEGRVGFKPWVYTGRWFSDPHGFGSVPELAAYPLWLADYSATAMPAPAAPWTQTSMWQFTDHATVPGISTPADGNRFNGSLDQLIALGKPGDLPPDDPYAPWSGLVGTGIIELMAMDNTTPAVSRSTFMPLGVNPADTEQCLGRNGILYVWALQMSQGFRYAPLG